MVPEPLRKGNCLLSVPAGLKVESFPEFIIRAGILMFQSVKKVSCT
jgi:hypothetical protein